MSWSLLWVLGFLALYLFLGARRLAILLLSIICGAVAAHPFLGQMGIVVGGLLGCGVGLVLVYVQHHRVVDVRRPAV